jgi:hypothetical protein
MPSLNRHDFRAALIRAINFARPAGTPQRLPGRNGGCLALCSHRLCVRVTELALRGPVCGLVDQYSVNGGSGLQAGPQC